MIEYIKGEIAELSPASATIDCNGLGYAVNISLNTYAAIQGKKAASYISMKLSAKTPISFMVLQTSKSVSCSFC
jgi:Holliday junction resolvasome RuvABC DNA-binding subunit